MHCSSPTVLVRFNYGVLVSTMHLDVKYQTSDPEQLAECSAGYTVSIIKDLESPISSSIIIDLFSYHLPCPPNTRSLLDVLLSLCFSSISLLSFPSDDCCLPDSFEPSVCTRVKAELRTIVYFNGSHTLYHHSRSPINQLPNQQTGSILLTHHQQHHVNHPSSPRRLGLPQPIIVQAGHSIRPTSPQPCPSDLSPLLPGSHPRHANPNSTPTAPPRPSPRAPPQTQDHQGRSGLHALGTPRPRPLPTPRLSRQHQCFKHHRRPCIDSRFRHPNCRHGHGH